MKEIKVGQRYSRNDVVVKVEDINGDSVILARTETIRETVNIENLKTDFVYVGGSRGRKVQPKVTVSHQTENQGAVLVE